MELPRRQASACSGTIRLGEARYSSCTAVHLRAISNGQQSVATVRRRAKALPPAKSYHGHRHHINDSFMYWYIERTALVLCTYSYFVVKVEVVFRLEMGDTALEYSLPRLDVRVSVGVRVQRIAGAALNRGPLVGRQCFLMLLLLLLLLLRIHYTSSTWYIAALAHHNGRRLRRGVRTTILTANVLQGFRLRKR